MRAKSSANTPAALGFRMPAEWEPHSATWIAWPHNPQDWPGRFQPIPWVYAEIVRHLVTGEDVCILVNDAAMRARAQKVLVDAHVDTSRVRFFIRPTDRVWLRDSGPIFLTNGRGKLAATDWRFNGWAKYPDWRLDDKVAAFVARQTDTPSFQPVVSVGKEQLRIVLEGGSIDVNGEGALLTTEECLLSEVQQRNPGVSRRQIEQVFAVYLGVKQVIWLKRGIAGDDTHGHVDDLARFVAPQTILTVTESDQDDDNYLPLQENLELLRQSRSTEDDGKPFKIITVPMPRPVIFRKQRLPASYANFYIANRVVLVPVFDDPNDRIALNALAELFPERSIVPIYSGDFIWGLGAMHCMTQQQPAI